MIVREVTSLILSRVSFQLNQIPLTSGTTSILWSQAIIFKHQPYYGSW